MKRLACFFESFGVRRAFHACFGVRRQFCHGETRAPACNPVNFWRAFPENAQRWRANEVTLHPGSGTCRMSPPELCRVLCAGLTTVKGL